jgi:hypothetical protein
MLAGRQARHLHGRLAGRMAIDVHRGAGRIGIHRESADKGSRAF